MSDNTGYAIKIDGLSWSFGERRVLEEINLTIQRGKFYSIIGPNGSGKTTLLRNITRALEPKGKTILIDDRDITRIRGRELAKKMACVYQNVNVDFDFNVMDIVLMGRTPYLGRFEIEGSKDIEIVLKAMEMTNTLHLKDKKINEISGGERQRVMAARAIAQDTEILLLDEPTSNLDVHHQIELLNTVRQLNEEKNVTVVAVLHDLNLAAQYSDYIILMKEGRVIACDEPEVVLTKENIEGLYNIEFCIIKNPVNNRPYIIPVANQFRGKGEAL